jgi:predicted signal transduction protein with EAL and GGDEF domain
MSATIFKQGSGSFSYKRDNQTFLLNTRFLPEIGWYLLVEQSLDEERINDEHGHPAGDAVLANIAETVHTCLREADSITRWGGQEFLAILKDCKIEDAFQIDAVH